MSMLQVFPGVTSFKSKSSSGLVAAEVAFASADVVGLYFSGAWCVPCRRFTQVLTGIYNDVKARGKNMEVVFISEDEDEERMELYYGDMPWLALQWSDVKRLKDQLQKSYACDSFPHLALVDPRAPFPPITLRGCAAVTCGPDAFPFTPQLIKAYRRALFASALPLLQQLPGTSPVSPLMARAAAKRFPLVAAPVPSLRIITLNIWGGRQLNDLIGFFRAHAPHTDVFCLQEVLDTDRVFSSAPGCEPAKQGSVYKAIQHALPDFHSAFAQHENAADRIAPAMFVRRSLGAGAIQSQLVYDKPTAATHSGIDMAKYFRLKLQHVRIPLAGADVLVANFHGLWHPAGKVDIPERLEISHAVRSALAFHSGPLLICGDFNLLPSTQALAILASGLRNPLLERGMTCTRTHLYRSFTDASKSLFADYVLLSPELRVRRFEVMRDVVSDHAALRCEVRM
jgi:endonuclease/exonuclease/phosphatase family metal-dependent hydrolase